MSEPGASTNPANIGAVKINGAASSMQNLTADLQYYVCYASSPLAFTNPNPNPPPSEETLRLINIQVT